MPTLHKSPKSESKTCLQASHQGLRKLLLASLAFGALVQVGAAADPSEKLTKALAFKPRQGDVNYEIVKPELLADCSIEETTRSDGKGFWVKIGRASCRERV